MSLRIEVLWSLPLLIFAALHLRGYLMVRAVRKRGETVVADIASATPFPAPPVGNRPDPDIEPLFQNLARTSRETFNGGNRPGADEYAAATAIAPVLLVPFRLIWWAWTARTWRPLALLAALLIVCASPVAWFSGVGGSPEVHRNAVAFAWDAGLVAAVQAPFLLVLGAWPWWRWRSLIAGAFTTVALVFWLVYVLPARP